MKKKTIFKVFGATAFFTSCVMVIYHELVFRERVIKVASLRLTDAQRALNLSQPTSRTEKQTGTQSWHETDGRVKHCPDLTINSEKRRSRETTGCKRHKSTAKDCALARHIYEYDVASTTCREKGLTQEICTIKLKGRNEFIIKCKWDVCEGAISVRSLNSETGAKGEKTRLRPSGSTSSQLEEQLAQVIRYFASRNQKFLFLSCDDGMISNNSQLLSFPIFHEDKNTERGKSSVIHTRQRYPGVNVNIYLLDSVSRAHFYRSLPKTVETFRKLNSDPSLATKVFDFELFQAVKGRTYETVHAFFTGELLPMKDPFSPNPKVVGIGSMFRKFKISGYRTLYQEDLCWKYDWGLVHDMKLTKSKEKWKELHESIEKMFIDDLGVTHASCEVLEKAGVKLPFNGPSEICFNGVHQSDYIFRYVEDTLYNLKTLESPKPLLSYAIFSVGHESTGRRIQTIDADLANHIERLSANEPNTITIIVSDHGNTYTPYTERTLEGRFEVFNPAFFVVIPSGAAKTLGKQNMEMLRVNQQRLLNIIDLHHTIMPMAESTNRSGTKMANAGLFRIIPANRTCNDLEMLRPNLCVCEGWDVAVAPAFQGAAAEFALGQLNAMIQAQYLARSGATKHAYGNCRRLKPDKLQNIRVRRKVGKLTTSMDLVVKAGNVVQQTSDVFHVEIEQERAHDEASTNMNLVLYSRMTGYREYKTCADSGVDLGLCICSLGKNEFPMKSNTSWKDYGMVFGWKTTSNLLHRDCVVLLIRSKGFRIRTESIAFEVASLCEEQTFDIVFDVQVANLRISTRTPLKVHLSPGSIHFLLSAVKDVWYKHVRLSAQVKVYERDSLVQTERISL